MQSTSSVLFSTLVLVSVIAARADAQAADSPLPNREIRNLLTGLEESFSQGDAARLAACWTSGGDLIGPAGDRITGRDNIAKAFEKSLAGHKDGKLLFRVLSSRVVNENLALVEGIAEVKPKPAMGGGQPRFSLVLVRQTGGWLIESGRESILHDSGPTDHLKELDWLVGQWSQETGLQSDIKLQNSFDWTENHAYLIRKFKIEGKAVLLHGGTEVVGWDPRSQRIRSWVFDSDGGFGENLWVRDGDRWLIKFSGTLANGTPVSATNFLSKVGATTLTLQSKDRTVNGERQTDIPEITLRRQVAETAKTAPTTSEAPKPTARTLP